MTPYLQDADFTLYNGDALEVLRELSPKYCELAAKRTHQLSLLGEDLSTTRETA